jgi:hypothetical protein
MKSKIGIIISELFNVSLVTYLILLLLETLSKGFVSDFFNLNILLGIVLISGIIMVSPLAEKRNLGMWDLVDRRMDLLLAKIKFKKAITENDFYFAILVSVGGGVLVYFKTQELGNLSILIGIITMVIIALLSYLIFTEDED